MSWEVIIPFLRPIEPFLRDPEVSDILVNGSTRIFIEQGGLLRELPGVTIPERTLQVAVRNIARVLGEEVSAERPLLDARLPDGSRVAAVFPPCSVNGTTLTIRKFQNHRYNVQELVRIGTLSARALTALQEAVERRRNILISGATGTGKTTFLNALASFIGDDERVIVIEDTSEIQIDKPNLVRLEARREQPGLPAVTIRELLKATLRLRPDRILLGEVRGGDAFDLLQALNTGHSGTLATLHADSAREALTRFTTCILQSGVELPYAVLRRQIADSVHLSVHLARVKGRRQVSEVLMMRRYESSEDRYDVESLYTADEPGTDHVR